VFFDQSTGKLEGYFDADSNVAGGTHLFSLDFSFFGDHTMRNS